MVATTDECNQWGGAAIVMALLPDDSAARIEQKAKQARAVLCGAVRRAQPRRHGT